MGAPEIKIKIKMEQIKSFFKNSDDKKGLQNIINEAVENDSKKLQLGASQDFKEGREDQEYNLIANKYFNENILGKKFESTILNEEEVSKIENYIKFKNEDLLNRIEAIDEYILDNSGSLDIEAYQDKVGKLAEIEAKIRELNHEIANQLTHAEHLNNEQAFYYGEQVFIYDQQLNQLDMEKGMLEREIDMDTPKIDLEEENELIQESEELRNKSIKYQNYLHNDSNQN